MDIEITVVGESTKWVLSQPRIRIGRDAHCEVSLSAARYPGISVEHLSLDTSSGAVKLANLGGSGILLNDNPAGDGFVVRSGDLLRLGVGGPELRIRVLEQESATKPFSATRVLPEVAQPNHEETRVMQVESAQAPHHEATRVMQVESAQASHHEATRVMQVEASRPQHEPTRVVGASGAASVPASPTPPAGSVGRYGYSSDAAQRSPIATPVQPRTVPLPTPRRADFSGNNPAVPAVPLPPESRAPQAPPAPLPVIAREEDDEDIEMIEGKLKGMRMILMANMAILVLLLVWIVQLNRQLAQTQMELREMHSQAQSAVAQFTPSLDARLGAFDKRMDAIDQKMHTAQDQMVSSIDTKMKSVEDRLVERMNAEIPAMLDKYINKKLADVKH
jgi:hypothetical protein